MALHALTKYCNQRCFFCSGEGRTFPGKTFRARRARILRDGDPLIRLSGGDPFLADPDELIKLIGLAGKKGKTVELQTNATLLAGSGPEKLKKLVSELNACGGYFNVNFSSSNAALDSKITGRRGFFAKRVAGLKLLDRLGARIRLTYVINGRNYRDVPRFCSFLLKKLSFADWAQFSFVKGMGKAEGRKASVPEYKEAGPYLVKGLDILEKRGFRFDVDHIPLCFLGKHWKKHVDVYKIKKNLAGLYLKEKKKLKSCENCRLYALCSGPRKDYLKIYKGI